MKKRLDNRFLFILVLSLSVLVVLGVGSFYLFDNSDSAFVKSGYVLNPLSGNVEKYFFNENTAYRENLSSMIEFKDVDDKDAKVLKDSFLHYMDGSLSFLKNGALLDLDSIKGTEAVAFYNITPELIIDKSGDGYVIKNAHEDINLKNFIGRISDTKYIVVGNLEAKIPGNNTNIKGDYFEIVYADNGIVNIENKDVKYQVTADGSFIYAGDIVLDLGNKKITRGNEDVMSITAITIDGNENIEIIPKDEEKETENNGDNNVNGDNNPDNQNADPNNGNGNGENGNGEGGNDSETIEPVKRQDTVVSLKDASIGSTNVDVTFDIYNAREDDSFTLRVTNLDSGRTIDMVTKVVEEQKIYVNLLSPNTKYLFTVVNERDNAKYFQKIFETTGFGIKLEKAYATDSEIGYKITIDKNTDITDATLSLYKYNEETKKNEIVKTSYYDANSGKTKEIEKVTKLSSLNKGAGGVYEVKFDGLDSDTIYTAVLDEFSLISSNFKDTYNITLTAMTLKKTPSNIKVDKSIETNAVKLFLSSVDDPDNAIISYSYLIYEKTNPNETVIDPITKTNASPVEIKFGTPESKLKNDTNYFYKVLIEYFDNEKYIEYVETDSINFVMGSDPYITVVPHDSKISYDKIAATIYLNDNSCFISMPGRSECDGPSTAYIDVTKMSLSDDKRISVFNGVVDFEVDDDAVKYELELDGLEENTTYTIEVRANRNDRPGMPREIIEHTKDSVRSISTKKLSNFGVDWHDEGSNSEDVINLKTKFVNGTVSDNYSAEETAKAIKKVVVKLYNGQYTENLQSVEPIGVKEFGVEDDLKKNFYDDGYVISSDKTFGLDITKLKEKNSGQLSEWYTISIDAYYDDAGVNKISLSNEISTYKVSPLLLLENVHQPTIEAEYITNGSRNMENYLNDEGTYIGYKVIAGFDRRGLLAGEFNPEKIRIYVYDKNKKRVKFYVENNGSLSLVDDIVSSLGESNGGIFEIFMGYGNEYGTSDNVMRRGNKYYIGYEVELTKGDQTYIYPNDITGDVPSNYGIYTVKEPGKETPKLGMYIGKSTNDSVIYHYELDDPDNALYRESNNDNYGLYYKINGGEEHKLDLNKVEAEYNKFASTITIPNLTQGDTYSIYYKKNERNTGSVDADILDYYFFENNEDRLFEGYYDANLEKYNFKYEIINRPLVDNKVTIKILGTEEILNRVLNYNVKFTGGGTTLSINVPNSDTKFVTCEDDTDELKRCFSVDYSILQQYGMKSGVNNEKPITVSITAMYDNGFSGYDYKLTGEDKDYSYMIMQNNNTATKYGNYVALTSNSNPTNEDNENIPKGYYTYKLAEKITYSSKLNSSNSTSMRYILTSNGYLHVTRENDNSSVGILNPKMVSSASVTSSGTNQFSFSSFTPKLSVTGTTEIINGLVANFSLKSATIDDFCDDDVTTSCSNRDNSEFYLYVEVWDNEELVGDLSKTVRPTLKFKINKDNPGASIRAIIDKLDNGKKYYYNVYAYLNKNNRRTYTQLFDNTIRDSYGTRTYDFTTLKASDVFHGLNVNHKTNSEGNYGDRLMDTTVNLIAYRNNVAFNFDVTYAFCEYGDTNCGIGDENSRIFKSTILANNLSTNFVDTVDISSYNLEYGKNYYMYMYAIFDYYDADMNLVKKALQINSSKISVNLPKLVAPSFTVERDAYIADGKYAIDFTINLNNDIHQTLKDGKYFVKLLDSNNNIVGDLQIKDVQIVNGEKVESYVTVAHDGDYEDYEFDARTTNKSIRITNLSANSGYRFVVYAMAEINNIDETEKLKKIEKELIVYTTTDYGVAFGTLDFRVTQNSVVVTFLGGSTFNNITGVSYTVSLWGSSGPASVVAGGDYDLTAGQKKFEKDSNTSNWRFVIDPIGMSNTLGQTYQTSLGFHIKNPNTGAIDYIDSSTPGYEDLFIGKNTYLKDNDNY